jgi:hypothetical protein
MKLRHNSPIEEQSKASSTDTQGNLRKRKASSALYDLEPVPLLSEEE